MLFTDLDYTGIRYKFMAFIIIAYSAQHFFNRLIPENSLPALPFDNLLTAHSAIKFFGIKLT
jgi:hypothetical protein